MNLKAGLNLTTLFCASILMLSSGFAHARPNLKKPVDFSVLHAKDSGYRFITRRFVLDVPELDEKTTDQLAQIKSQAGLLNPHEYMVYLGIPTAYDEEKNHEKIDILYLLDGNAVVDDIDVDTLKRLSHSAQQTSKTIVKQAPILVFIGYSTPYRFDVQARALDYTPAKFVQKKQLRNPHYLKSTDLDTFMPPLDSVPSAFKKIEQERLNGGAARFSQFISTQIKPWVYAELVSFENSTITTNPNTHKQIADEINPNHVNQLKPNKYKETLWGHSFGALFVVNEMLTRPQNFDSYHAADPSLWWQNAQMLRVVEALREQNKNNNIALMQKLANLSNINFKVYFSDSERGREPNQSEAKPTHIAPFVNAHLKLKSNIEDGANEQHNTDRDSRGGITNTAKLNWAKDFCALVSGSAKDEGSTYKQGLGANAHRCNSVFYPNQHHGEVFTSALHDLLELFIR